MKIGIDCRGIGWSGVGRYTQGLLKGLAEVDKENEYLLFCNKDSENLALEASNFVKEIVNLPVLSPLSLFSWGRRLKKLELDVFHSPHFPFPWNPPCPSVVTIQDLIPLIFPESMPSRTSRAYYRYLNKLAVKKAKKIVVSSLSTKRDLVRLLRISREKVEVIPYATAENFKVTDDKEVLDKVREKHQITKPFILSVGNPKPHKNWAGLIRAFHLIKRGGQIDLQLVLIGPEDSRFPGPKESAQELELERDILFLRFVDEEDLPLVYNAAEVYVQPSYCEGFGLPVLEAMACGTPVISSNASSLPEVTGEAALFIDPKQPLKMAEAIEKMLTDKTLAQRLKRKGLKRAAEFSWEKTAQETLRIYQEIGALDTGIASRRP